MKPALFGLLVAVCVVMVSVEDASAAGKAVIELTDSNFKARVLDSEELWFVEFYAPWCGHCKNLAPEWARAAKNLEGMVNIAAVDATVHQKYASQYGVKGYPTIKVFRAGKNRKPIDYNGARTAKAIVDQALYYMPSAVKTVTSASLDKFGSGDGPHVLLLTSKKKTSTLYKALSNKFGQAAFGEVHSSQEAVSERFGVDSYPTLLAFAAGAGLDGEPAVYDGKLKIADITEWLSGVIGDPTGGGSGGSGKGSASDPDWKKYTGGPEGKSTYKAPGEKKAKKPLAVNEITGASEGPGSMAAACTDPKGVCVITFFAFDGEEQCTSENPTVEEKQEARNVLPNADDYATVNALAARFRKDPLLFSWMDAAKQSEFASAFGIDTFPAVVALKTGKRTRFTKWTTEDGSLDEAGVAAFLDRVVGGDATFTKASDLPDLAPEEGCSD